MKRHSKAILIGLAVVVAILLIAVLGAKAYVESAGTRDRVAAALSKALGLPVTVARVRLTFPDGVIVEGVTIPTENGNFLEEATLVARCRLAALLRRKIAIYGLRAEHPKIVWRQSPDAKWTLPERPKTASAEPPREQAPKEKPTERSAVSVEGFELINGDVRFIGKDQQPVATLTGVKLDFRRGAADRGEGTLTVDRLLWGEVPFEKLHSTVKYTEGELTLAPLTASLGGGGLTGTITAQPNVHGVPFTAALQLTATNLERLMNETGWAPNQFTGVLNGSLEARGTFRRLVKIEGKGKLLLSDGAIRQLEVLATLAENLGIPELADLRPKDAVIDIRLGDEKAFVDQLALNSPGVKILGNGLVRLNGRIDLDARFVLSQAVIDRIPETIRGQLLGDTIDFKVTGSMKKPKTDLMDRLLSGKKLTDQFVDVFSTLVGPKDKKKDDEKKKDNKKKPEAQPAAPPPPPPATDPTVTTLVPPADPVPAPPPPQP